LHRAQGSSIKKGTPGSLFFTIFPPRAVYLKLILLGQFVKLRERKNQAVLADIFFSHIAAAAFPDPALHPHLQHTQLLYGLDK